MCGICGIHDLGALGPSTEDVSAMTARLERRGPDDAGFFAEGPVALGHRRLSILDLSPAGHQPMESASGRYVISFNGEIYNHEEIREELGVTVAALRSRTDTEVILEAWDRWGEAALPRFVGQFAFAIYDREERRLCLVRDRFGEKPLFYHHQGSRLSFASTTQALSRARGVGCELDDEALLAYVALRYTLAPRTLLRGVQKLPGGHLLRADRDGIQVSRWYEFPDSSHAPRRSSGELVEEFDELLARASLRCLVSDVPVALFLSDGIDSNAIRASLEDQEAAIKAYTYVPEEDAAGWQSSDRLPPGAEPVIVSAHDRMGQLDQAFGALNEPVGDGVALATWQLVRNARDRATVFLCGHGGDEVMAGYRMNLDLWRQHLLHGLAWMPGSWMDAMFRKYTNGYASVGDARAQMRSVDRLHSPDASRYTINRPLPAEELAKIFGPQRHLEQRLSGVDDLYSQCSATGSTLDRMQHVLLKSFLPANLLSFADAMAMDSSAELRMPFLDRDLSEFVLRLPSQLRARPLPDKMSSKVLLRRWAKQRLDSQVVRRKKSGFASGSISHLLLHDRDAVAERILGVPALRERMPGLESWLAQPADEFRGAKEGSLWALLSLGIWYDALGRD